MSESEKPDHWGDLLSDLGIENIPQEKVAEQPPVEPVRLEPLPVPRAKSSGRTPSAESRRASGDWFRLAAELGVEVPPEEPPAKTAEIEAPPVEEPPPRAAEEEWFEPVEPSPEARESLAEAEMALEELDEWDAESELIERPDQDREESEKKGRRRRKRRRKTRRPDEPSAARSERREEIEPLDLIEAELVETTDDEEVSQETAAEGSPADREASADEPAQKRLKRRRRRRSSRNKGSQESALAEGVAKTAPASEANDDDVESDELDEPIDEEDDEVSDGQGRRDRRALHRGIPTWKDAVDVVISANLESRSKRPDRAPGPRGRGGRSRGGRDRSDRNG